MRSRTWTGVAFLATVAAAAATAGPAGAAPKRISGRLSRSGYTVIALASNGKAKSARVRHHRFSLRPPARRVTLHVRTKKGRYAGPIVIARKRKGRLAILGVKAGARLGRVKLHRGYATLARRLRRKWVDTRRRSRARHGIPIGARRFGRVRSRRTHRGAPGDRDLDGIPNALDIDDDGDLVLDNFERRGRAGAAQSGCTPPCAADLGLASQLELRLEESVNANAGALSLQDLDARLAAFGTLRIGYPHDAATELDCGGLAYCSRGGSGIVAYTGPPSVTPANGPPFPGCCDPDGDGFGAMNLAAFDPGSEGHPAQFFLAHGATTQQIRAGDVLIERATSGGHETQFPITLQGVFATVPALVSYSDTAGHSGTVSYPLLPPFTGSPPGPGQPREGFTVSAGAGGDVVLTLIFWRPQRQPIPGEKGTWIDIGHLLYSASPQGAGATPGPNFCPQSALSTTDPSLTPAGVPLGGGGFRDRAADRAADPANALRLSLDVTQCLAAHGLSWQPGQRLEIAIVATNSGNDLARQRLFFRLQ